MLVIDIANLEDEYEREYKKLDTRQQTSAACVLTNELFRDNLLWSPNAVGSTVRLSRFASKLSP
ncbi:MAG: hypothetical protein JWM11_6726 [Planctomycetaceae bacterium]|nr:hypothetical protein [Planctomycetaceae bacterium]